jgi:hypothetical protein
LRRQLTWITEQKAHELTLRNRARDPINYKEVQPNSPQNRPKAYAHTEPTPQDHEIEGISFQALMTNFNTRTQIQEEMSRKCCHKPWSMIFTLYFNDVSGVVTVNIEKLDDDAYEARVSTKKAQAAAETSCVQDATRSQKPDDDGWGAAGRAGGH